MLQENTPATKKDKSSVNKFHTNFEIKIYSQIQEAIVINAYYNEDLQIRMKITSESFEADRDIFKQATHTYLLNDFICERVRLQTEKATSKIKM